MPRRLTPRPAFRIMQTFSGGLSMPFKRGNILYILVLILILAPLHASAEGSNSGTVRGTVTDVTGALIPGATVHLINEVSGLDRTVSSDATGQFFFANVPFNPYPV